MRITNIIVNLLEIRKRKAKQGSRAERKKNEPRQIRAGADKTKGQQLRTRVLFLQIREKTAGQNPNGNERTKRENPNGSVVSSFGECPQSCTGATFHNSAQQNRPEQIRAEPNGSG